MTFEATIADITVFCEHENQKIREFAVQAVEYAPCAPERRMQPRRIQRTRGRS